MEEFSPEIRAMMPSRLQTGNGYAHMDYFWVAPAGVTKEHVLNPHFWQHRANRFRVHDTVEIVAADGSFDLTLRVAGIDPLGHWVRMRVLWEAPKDDGAAAREDASLGAPGHDGYAIQHDPVDKWRITRGKDVIEHGLPSEGAAKAMLADLRAAGRKAA